MTNSEDATVCPEHAGAADAGVISSVGGGGPGRRRHRRRGRQRAPQDRAGAGRGRAARRRRRHRRPAAALGGVVREILEHEAAERRVVFPAVEGWAADALEGGVRYEQTRLVDLLGRYDALNPEVTPDDARTAIGAVMAYERSVDESSSPSWRPLRPTDAPASARTSARSGPDTGPGRRRGRGPGPGPGGTTVAPWSPVGAGP